MEKFKKFALSSSELKLIVGGIYKCQCDGGAKGTWTGTYKDQDQADRAASYWCSGPSGGHCDLA